jgi:long-chain acyl-CoA synthetase
MTISSIAGLVRRHARERPDRPALTADDQTWTFAELDRRSSKVAQALQAEGVGPEDRIAFLDKNSPEHFDVLLGGAKLGAVNVAVNWRLAAPEVAFVVNDAQAKVLVVGQEFVGALGAIEAELTAVKKIVVIGGDERHEAYANWVAPHAAEDPCVEAGPDDVACQLYTSGTTGLPKGVMLTNRNLFSLLPKVVSNWGLDEDSVTLAPMPLFHIAGSGIATAGMFVGCHTILMREVDPPKMLELAVETGVTHLGAVPAILQVMLMMPGVQDMDFPALRYVLYGASPISGEVLSQALRTFGCSFIQMYGLTETTGLIAMLMPEDHDPHGPTAHRLRSAGKPVTGVDVRIVSPETGEDVPPGEVGEIWCRTDQNMKGYWNKPDETARTITTDGWLKTGDAGYLDEDGYLYIHDRLKDMIISGGENVYPAEVESVLMGHPAVADVAVIGVPSDRWGETVKAMVVRAAGDGPTPEEVVAYARDRLAHYKCPTSVDFVDALPRNPAGKVLKRELRAPYWVGRDRSVS